MIWVNRKTVTMDPEEKPASKAVPTENPVYVPSGGDSPAGDQTIAADAALVAKDLPALAVEIPAMPTQATLTSPTAVPVVGRNGTQIGTITLPAGTTVSAEKEDQASEKTLIKTNIGETWVNSTHIQIKPVTVSSTNPSRLTEWPQWRGPQRNGVAYFSPSLANAWPHAGPKRVWTASPVSVIAGPYAGGHSSPVIAGGKVYQYIADKEGRHDIVICLDSAHGTTKWIRRFEAPYRLMHGASGTPCIADNRVYIMGGRNAYCLDANTGNPFWLRISLMNRNPNFPGDYLQEESSSFVVGEGVAAVVVDKFAGIDLATGKTLWTTPSPGGYALAMASAVFWSHEGKNYLIYNGATRICCVNPSNGKVVWEVTGDGPGGDHVHTPVVLNDYLICFWRGKLGFYHLSLDGPQCFYEASMTDKHSSPIAFKNRAYFVGCPDKMSSTAVVCHNLETGAIIWRRPVKNPEYSSPILADNKIFLLTDQGKKLTMIDALNGVLLGECPIDAKPWTSPAYAMGCLFVRKPDDGISCYDLTAKNNVSTSQTIECEGLKVTAASPDLRDCLKMASGNKKRLTPRGGRVWTFYAQRFLSDENRSIPIRNLCLRLPMAYPLASASRREATRTSPHVPEASAQRHFLCSQEWLSLAHAAKRFSDLENRLPPLSMLVAFGVAGEHQCAPAPNAAAIGGQKQTAHRRDHRQPKRALQRARRAGWLRCGQKDQGAQTLRLCRYTGLASGRGHYPGQHHRTLRSQGASSTCSPQSSAQNDLG